MERISKTVFLVGVVGGLVGYGCGALFTPGRATAQSIGPGPADDAGSSAAGASGSSSGSTTPSPASAPGSGPCQRWEVKQLATLVFTDPVTIDDGWEPFGYSGTTATVMLRRCVLR